LRLHCSPVIQSRELGTVHGFLLAKDSLIKSSHASHPIAGQGAATWRGRGQAARSTSWGDG